MQRRGIGVREVSYLFGGPVVGHGDGAIVDLENTIEAHDPAALMHHYSHVSIMPQSGSATLSSPGTGGLPSQIAQLSTRGLEVGHGCHIPSCNDGQSGVLLKAMRSDHA